MNWSAVWDAFGWMLAGQAFLLGAFSVAMGPKYLLWVAVPEFVLGLLFARWRVKVRARPLHASARPGTTRKLDPPTSDQP